MQDALRVSLDSSYKLANNLSAIPDQLPFLLDQMVFVENIPESSRPVKRKSEGSDSHRDHL
jgi:hypothetical protein